MINFSRESWSDKAKGESINKGSPKFIKLAPSVIGIIVSLAVVIFVIWPKFNEIVKWRTGSEIEKWLTHVSDTYEALHNDSETEKKAYLVDLSKAFSSSPKINPGLAKVIAGVTAWPSAFNYKDAPTAEYEAARNERLMGEDLGKIKSYRKKSVCFS